MPDTTTDLAVRTQSTADLISGARHALLEAKTLPDIRRVMEAASVAADAGRRAAKLAEAQGLAAEAVRDAEAAANDVAALRIEAQAKAGELLREMDLDRGGRPQADGKRSRTATGLNDLGVSKSESSRWQQVAAVPADTRQEYIEGTRATGGEVTTSGLLRHAEKGAADGWTANITSSETNRYRLALARIAEQASHIAQFDPKEAAQVVDENSAVVLEAAAKTWEGWVARFLQARSGLHVITGGR